MNARREYKLSYQLGAGSIDLQKGILRGVTVAKSGVQATGKFVFLDRNGKVTMNPQFAASKVPVFTDDKTLMTLLGAAQDAGGRVKVRSDHDDAIDKRAGKAAEFKRDGDRVSCNIELFDSYKDRAIVLETADKTPELLGCSIDFRPSFELIDGKAMMRVEELFAVDLVDEGAITPAGLYMARGVDNENKEDEPAESQPHLTMADKTTPPAPTLDDCMKGLSALADTVNALAASFKQFSAPASAPSGQASAEKAIEEKLAAFRAEQEKFQAEQRAAVAKMAQERQALGLSAEKVKALDTLAEETERERLASEKEKGVKSYLQLVSERATAEKLSKSEAHRLIQKENPDSYQKHLLSLGVIRADRMVA